MFDRALNLVVLLFAARSAMNFRLALYAQMIRYLIKLPRLLFVRAGLHFCCRALLEQIHGIPWGARSGIGVAGFWLPRGGTSCDYAYLTCIALH